MPSLPSEKRFVRKGRPLKENPGEPRVTRRALLADAAPVAAVALLAAPIVKASVPGADATLAARLVRQYVAAVSRFDADWGRVERENQAIHARHLPAERENAEIKSWEEYAVPASRARYKATARLVDFVLNAHGRDREFMAGTEAESWPPCAIRAAGHTCVVTVNAYNESAEPGTLTVHVIPDADTLDLTS